MYNYKLTHVIFNDGTEIKPGKLTVIVGPNNTGKSRVLKEISAKTTSGRQIPSIVVKDVKWILPDSLQELRDAYNVERYPDVNNNWSLRTLAPDLCNERNIGGAPWPKSYEQHFQGQTKIPLEFFAENFGSAMVAFLTTEYRLQLVKDSPSPADGRQIANLLQMLYQGGNTTERHIRELVKLAFNREIALDFTGLQRLLLRVGDDFSTLPPDPREARPIMLQKEKLDEQGDGIRGFVGILVAMLSVNRSLFLIDEPEAFLHPPQAFRIGEFLADQANETRQIIIATHSADVLQGIISKTQNVDILRIDRIGNTNYFKLLESNRLKEIVNDPLLSSARVLDGLFYTGAIVVEANSDARFYQAASRKRKVDFDFHFVNADNKQTVARITRMYKDMGIRCAGLVDFDVLNNQTELEKQLKELAFSEDEIKQALLVQNNIAHLAKEIPAPEKLEHIEQQMTDLMATIKDSHNKATDTPEQLFRKVESKLQELADSTKSWKQFKQYGRSALPPEFQHQFDQLSEMCATKGLFINPCGELESMLMDYGIPYTTDKRNWIIQALKLLPNLEVDDEKYPWKLVKRIHERFNN